MPEIVPASRFSMKLQNLGFFADRLMWWCRTRPPNFGDWIGPTLFERRTGKTSVFAPIYARPNRAAVYLSAGSIMSSISVPGVAVVWGTGCMNRVERFHAPREIRAVRGPITRARCLELGYPCPDVYGDPGLVLPAFIPPIAVRPSVQLGIVPHFADYARAIELFGNVEEVRIIDVTEPVTSVVRAIQECEALVSSSLHGIIVSHAYGRPCGWVRFSNRIAGDGTKFQDYFLSIGIDPPTAAHHVSAHVSVPALKRLATAAGTPEVGLIAERLLRACPF